MSRRRIGWNLASTTYDKLVIAAVQLALVPLLAHGWGVPLYGCWVLLTAVPGFLALGDLGFGGAAFARMTALVARGERDEAVVVLHTARQVVALACVVLAIVTTMAIWAVPASWLPLAPGLSATAARIVLELMLVYTVTILLGALQFAGFASIGLIAVANLITTHMFLLESALLALAVLTGHGPVAGAAAMATGRLVGNIVKVLWLRRTAPWMTWGLARASGAERRLLARSAASMLAVPLSQATALQGTVMVLGLAAGPAATPAFAATRTLSRIGLQATQLLTRAVMPEFARAQAQGDGRGQAAMLLAVCGLALALALPFAMFIAAGGDWLLRVWTGGAVTAPRGLMPVMAVSILLGGLWNPLSTLMIAIDRQAVFAWAYLGFATLSLLVTYLLAPTLGPTAGAVGFGALDGCMALIVGRFAWQHWLRGLPMREVARSAVGRLRRRAG